MVLDVQALTVDKGDTAWMLVSTILVLMMILPGLALFYGGLVRTKNMLSILSQVLGITAVDDPGLGRLGLFARLRRRRRARRRPRQGLPARHRRRLGRADLHRRRRHSRARLRRLPDDLRRDHRLAHRRSARRAGEVRARSCSSPPIWLTIVYAPLAHMVWAPDGLIFGMGALDFAGGTVVHINSGIAGLVGVFFAGKRHRLPQGSDSAPFAGLDPGRRGPALGRLVRLQRRLGAGGLGRRGGGDDQHLRRARRGGARPGC